MSFPPSAFDLRNREHSITEDELLEIRTLHVAKIKGKDTSQATLDALWEIESQLRSIRQRTSAILNANFPKHVPTAGDNLSDDESKYHA